MNMIREMSDPLLASLIARRKELGHTMGDFAEFARLSIAEISEIETERPVPPKGYTELLSAFIERCQREREKAESLAQAESPVGEAQSNSPQQLEFAFDEPPYRLLQKVREEFHRLSPNTRSDEDHVFVGSLFHKCFDSNDLLDVIENKLSRVDPKFVFRVRLDLGTVAAKWDSKGIIFSENLYLRLKKKERLARKVAAHEIGHFLCHPDPQNFEPKQRGKFKKFKAEEAEADRVAIEILMPRSVVRKYRTAGTLAMICEVPHDDAAARIDEVTGQIGIKSTFSAKKVEVRSSTNSVSCFLSYSSRDSREIHEWISKLAETLCKKGLTVRFDKWDVRPGVDLFQYIEDSIRDSSNVLFVCTPSFAQRANGGRGFVGYEKAIACGKMINSTNAEIRFIPILRSGTPQTAIPSFLSSLHYLDMRDDSRFEKVIEELLCHIAPKTIPSLMT